MKYPHDAPIWLQELLNDRQALALDSFVAAKTQEQLWSIQGRMSEIQNLRNEVNLLGEREEAEARELQERLTTHAG